MNYEKYFDIFMNTMGPTTSKVPHLDIDKIAKNIGMMIVDRGGTQPDVDSRLTAMLLTNRAPSPGTSFRIKLFHLTGGENLLLVCVFMPVFGVNECRKLVTALSSKFQDDKCHVTQFVLVSEKKFTRNAKSEIMNLVNTSGVQVDVTYFIYTSLLVPYTQHELVPHHSVIKGLQNEEELLKRPYLDRSKMPMILIDDPICRWYGFKKGNIIEISRRFGGCNQQELFYRIVV